MVLNFVIGPFRTVTGVRIMIWLKISRIAKYLSTLSSVSNLTPIACITFEEPVKDLPVRYDLEVGLPLVAKLLVSQHEVLFLLTEPVFTFLMRPTVKYEISLEGRI